TEPPTLELLIKQRSRSPRWSSSPEQPSLILGRSKAGPPAVCAWGASCRRQYEQGDYKMLLEALFAWLSTFQGPPEWMADAFCKRLLDWFEYRAPTLDAAFGVKRPRGKHLQTLRERQYWRGEILAQIEAQRQRGRRKRKIDIGLFNDVGAAIGKS